MDIKAQVRGVMLEQSKLVFEAPNFSKTSSTCSLPIIMAL